MSDTLIIPEKGTKEEIYEALIPQISALIGDEKDLIANLANVSAALREAFNWHWVGFYLVKDDQLVLGPFQGPIACTRISYGKGVCGTAWKEGNTIIVPDVDAFPGHIACSSLSKSEIVLPFKNKNGEIIGVFDLDSADLNTYDEVDEKYLKKVLSLLV